MQFSYGRSGQIYLWEILCEPNCDFVCYSSSMAKNAEKLIVIT